MFNYSIIIPHKNIPSLLRRCLDSIPNRSDLEVIVVDDNSNEETIKDLETIHRENFHIIYTKEGKGAGYARNIGINKAQGKWILFADADDFYEKDFNNILSDYKNSDADCIFFSVNSAYSNTLQKANRNHLYDKYISFFNPQIPHSEDWIIYNKWEPWNKIISRFFLQKHQIKFDEISRCNDMIFCTLVSFFSSKIQISPRCLYCVTFRQDSMSTKKNSFKEFRDGLLAIRKRNFFLKAIQHEEWQIKLKEQYIHYYKRENKIKYYLFRIAELSLRFFQLRDFLKFKRKIILFKHNQKKEITQTHK